eukprot:3029269-Pyramimonas_sp.AAC.1
MFPALAGGAQAGLPRVRRQHLHAANHVLQHRRAPEQVCARGGGRELNRKRTGSDPTDRASPTRAARKCPGDARAPTLVPIAEDEGV